MQVITTVTQKGQITLPKQFRDAFGIGQYDTVIVEKGTDHIKIKPTEDILDLAGTFTPKKNKKKTALDARAAMEKQYKRF